MKSQRARAGRQQRTDAFFPATHLTRNPKVGDRAPQSGCLQYPNRDSHHHNHVQDGLDAGGHGDKPIGQPQRHSYNDERYDQIIRGMFLFSLRILEGSWRYKFYGKMRAFGVFISAPHRFPATDLRRSSDHAAPHFTSIATLSGRSFDQSRRYSDRAMVTIWRRMTVCGYR